MCFTHDLSFISELIKLDQPLQLNGQTFCIAEENTQLKQLNALVPFFIGTSTLTNEIGTWVPKEGHTWQRYLCPRFLRFQGISYSEF